MLRMALSSLPVGGKAGQVLRALKNAGRTRMGNPPAAPEAPCNCSIDSRADGVRSMLASAISLLSCVLAPYQVLAVDDPLWLAKSPSIDPTALPLDNQRYTRAPRLGYIYPCDPRHYFSIPLGSSRTGAWVDVSKNSWDITQKPYVHGAVSWPDASFRVTASATSGTRILEGNGLPVGGTTGIYPVPRSDPAYEYDPNPNTVKPHLMKIALPINPVVNPTAACLQPVVGYALDGVAFEFALSSYKGHDEIAYEMQDSCGTMPGPVGGLHRHALSSCIPHITERNALVGYALDGFGIFSPFDTDGRELATKDLDECHGTTSPVLWEGQQVTMYHYVLTRDYPYTIGCFRGTPNYQPLPPPPLSARIRGFFIRSWEDLRSRLHPQE